MMTKREIINDKLGVEAGYVNNTDDLGDATNHGITQAKALEFKDHWGDFGWDGDMKTMPIEFAYYVFDVDFWNKMYLDNVYELSPSLAERMLDFGVNAGIGNAVKSLQRILNVHNKKGTLWPNLVVDGGMGPASLRALQAYFDVNDDSRDAKLTGLMFSMQDYHYINISEGRSEERNETFTNGWTNRTWRDKLAFYRSFI